MCYGAHRRMSVARQPCHALAPQGPLRALRVAPGGSAPPISFIALRGLAPPCRDGKAGSTIQPKGRICERTPLATAGPHLVSPTTKHPPQNGNLDLEIVLVVTRSRRVPRRCCAPRSPPSPGVPSADARPPVRAPAPRNLASARRCRCQPAATTPATTAVPLRPRGALATLPQGPVVPLRLAPAAAGVRPTLGSRRRPRSRSFAPAWPVNLAIFRTVRVSTRTPSPNKLLSVG